MFDLNEAGRQHESGPLLPDGSIVAVHATLRPGGAGDGGWLKRNKAGTGFMLDFEFTVLEGEFAKRKFWTLLTVQGETEGQQKAADISRSRLRAMLESAKGINPADESEAAVKARQVPTLAAFDGIRFWAVVGVEEGKDGYKDKNVLKAVVTPDKAEWRKLEQLAQPTFGGATTGAVVGAIGGAVAPAATSRPSWAA